MKRTSCTLLIALVLASCNGPGRSAQVRGEVRGMPSALTVYAAAIVVPTDDVASLTAVHCARYADSIARADQLLEQAWQDVYRAEFELKLANVATALDCKAYDCPALADHISYHSRTARSGTAAELAKDPVAQQLRAKVVEPDRLRRAHLDSVLKVGLTQAVLALVPSRYPLDAQGRFSVPPHDTTMQTVVVVNHAEHAGYGVIPEGFTGSLRLLAYDTETFDIKQKCKAAIRQHDYDASSHRP